MTTDLRKAEIEALRADGRRAYLAGESRASAPRDIGDHTHWTCGWDFAALEAKRAQPIGPPSQVDPLAGWMIERADTPPFKAIRILAPNGYQALAYSHDRNPGGVLYLLADALLKGKGK